MTAFCGLKKIMALREFFFTFFKLFFTFCAFSSTGGRLNEVSISLSSSASDKLSSSPALKSMQDGSYLFVTDILIT